MIKIAVVEDELEMSNILVKFINKFFEENELDVKVTVFNNALKFLDAYNFNFDLIFMDINMPSLDGINASKKLREIDSEVMLIFVTSLAQYAIKGYEVNAFDFIVKPISYYNFALKLTRAIDNLSKDDTKIIVINSKTSIKKIKVRKICYIEVIEHKLIFHTTEGDFVSYGTLKTYQELLKDDHFCLCNQCYFVNLKYVTEVKDNIVIVNNHELQISRPKRKDFIQNLNLFLSSGGVINVFRNYLSILLQNSFYIRNLACNVSFVF